MATFSQFKSKYITEVKKPLHGDSLDKNIIDKFVNKPLNKIEKNQRKVDKRIKSDLNIPDDGGKTGQSRIEKELDLNKPNNTNKLKSEISNRKLDQLKKQELVKKQMGTFDDLSDGGNTSNTNVKKNVVKTKNVVKPDKFSDVVKKFQGSTSNTSKLGVSDQIKQIQQDYLNKLKDQKPKVNVNQTSTTNPSLPNFTKQKTNFSGRIGNVTNITKNKGPQIPDFKKTPPLKDLSTKREIKRIFDRDRLNRGLKNLDTSDLDKQISTKIDDKLSKRAFKDFRKDSAISSIKTKVAKSPRLAKALKFGGPVLGAVDSAITFRNTYKQSQAQGDTKRRSLGKAASKVAGGIIGGALGAAGGTAVAPGAGTYVGGVGGYVAGQAAGEKLFNTLTTSKGRKQIAKSFKNFRNRAMKPVGS